MPRAASLRGISGGPAAPLTERRSSGSLWTRWTSRRREQQAHQNR